MKLWVKTEVDEKPVYQTRIYSSVIPQQLSSEGKSVKLRNDQVVVCKVSTDTLDKMITQKKICRTLKSITNDCTNEAVDSPSKRTLFTAEDSKISEKLTNDSDLTTKVETIMPLVLSELKEAGRLDIHYQFCCLAVEKEYPMSNIAYFCFPLSRYFHPFPSSSINFCLFLSHPMALSCSCFCSVLRTHNKGQRRYFLGPFGFLFELIFHHFQPFPPFSSHFCHVL